MIRKLYPADQIEKYLFIDIAALVLLAYIVFIEMDAFGLAGKLVLYVTFFGTFYVSLWFRDWRLLSAILGNCGVLAVLAIHYEQSMVNFAFIPADLLGRARSNKVIVFGMLGIAVMHALIYVSWHGDLLSIFRTYQFPVLVLQLILPIVVHMREKSRSLKRELAEANEKIERYIQEGERSRIARDLHDTIGQTLTMIKLKCELAARLVDKQPERAKSEIGEVIETSRFALKQVRELVTSMKYVSLKEELLHAEKLLETAGIRLTVIEKDGLPPDLSSVAETMLALSLREAFTNMVKHSRASDCIVRMGLSSSHEYEITAVDNGEAAAERQGGGDGIAMAARKGGDGNLTAVRQEGGAGNASARLQGGGNGMGTAGLQDGGNGMGTAGLQDGGHGNANVGLQDRGAGMGTARLQGGGAGIGTAGLQDGGHGNANVGLQDRGAGIGAAGLQDGGHGIQSIRERMRLVQGEAVIAASPEGGVAVTLRVPVVQPSERTDVS